MKIAPAVFSALAVILALVLVDTCARRDERHKLEARQRDTRDDSTVSRLIWEASRAESAFRRERDSTGREIRRLQQRLSGVTPAAPLVGPTLVSAPTAPELALRDSLVDVLLAARTQDSLQILFWRAQVAQRDTVIRDLQASRNAWRGRSEKRFACVGGPAVAMSLSGRGVIGVGATCGWRF